MRLLICSCGEVEQGNAFEETIRDQLPGMEMLRAQSLQEMVSLLRQPMNNILILVIFAPTPNTVDDLFRVRSFFDDKKLILILPSRDNDNFIRAIQLNPSFIGAEEEGFDDVLLVLKRICGRQQTMKRIYKDLRE